MARRSRTRPAPPGRKPAPARKAAPAAVDEARPVTRRGALPWLGGGLVLAGILCGGVYLAVRDPDSSAASTADRRAARPGAAPERLAVRVHARHPHAIDAFTQGLVWHRGRLFESTGRVGHSSVREVDLRTGRVLRKVDDDAAVFAEGLAVVGDRLIQLTWQDGRAFVWSLDRFELLDEHHYDGEGWGLCHDGSHLVMSDGSATLRFRDPRTFEVRRSVQVTHLGRPVGALNELECVDGKVYANVWQSDEIVRIDPRTGAVDAVVDARGLLPDADRASVDVLNGIAWIPERRRFLLTGKLWPTMFEVTFEPR